jgi:hypothetical protein
MADTVPILPLSRLFDHAVTFNDEPSHVGFQEESIGYATKDILRQGRCGRVGAFTEGDMVICDNPAGDQQDWVCALKLSENLNQIIGWDSEFDKFCLVQIERTSMATFNASSAEGAARPCSFGMLPFRLGGRVMQ